MERNSDGRPTNESQEPSEDIVITSELEKKAILAASINYLTMMTWHEYAGRLSEEFIAENNALRSVVTRLIINLNKKYSAEDLSTLGINEVPKSEA